jgi:hypothetical protein
MVHSVDNFITVACQRENTLKVQPYTLLTDKKVPRPGFPDKFQHGKLLPVVFHIEENVAPEQMRTRLSPPTNGFTR